MKVLFVGDVVGRPGRRCLKNILPQLCEDKKICFVIANGENAAGGVGITQNVAMELFECGINVITSGNHIWDKKEVFSFIDQEERLLRPANYPEDSTPGQGINIFNIGEYNIGVLNVAGRVFMPTLDCPFRVALKKIKELYEHTNIIFVDFHAEATSEKMAMGWFLDGMVTAVIGTHTHIQTADERLLPKGTAYITDVGMTGPYNSVLGVETEDVIKKFITGLPVRFNISKSDLCQFNGVVIEFDPKTGKSTGIERVNENFQV